MLNTKSSFFKGEFLIFLTGMIWSTSALLARLANLNPILLVALRSFFALAVLLPVVKFKLKINKFIVIGALCYVANTLLYYISLDYTTAGNAIVLCYTAPIFVLIWSCLYFKKKPSGIQLLVLLMTFGGIVFIFFNDLAGGGLLGDVLALFGGLAFSGLFFINSLPGSSPIHSTIYGSMASSFLTLFFISDIAAMSGASWFWVAVMGVIEIGFSYILFSAGMKKCSGFNASLISTVEVVFCPIWVAIYFKEKIDIYTIIGGLVILSAIVINILNEKRQSKKT